MLHDSPLLVVVHPDNCACARSTVSPNDGRAPVLLATTPLVHATALHQANSALLLGGTVVMLGGRRLDGVEVCELIHHERVTTFPVIGDVVARRVVYALEVAEQLDTGTILAMTTPADGWAFPSGSEADYVALTMEAIEADS